MKKVKKYGARWYPDHLKWIEKRMRKTGRTYTRVIEDLIDEKIVREQKNNG